MRFLIAGLGSIGRRHLRNLLALEENDIILYRTHQSTISDSELSDFPVETDMYRALERKPDAVIISNPTSLHMQVAIPSAQAGCALFIEKPIAYQLDELQPLEEAIRQNQNIVFTAYQFRFNPGLRKIAELIHSQAVGRPLSFCCHWGEYLPDWHPWEDYRKSYAARQDLGGGVVLTLCHPLDYLRWLFGEATALFAFSGHASDLQVDVEDFAETIIQFRKGVSGSLHLDYYRRPKRHDLEIICAEGVLFWEQQSSGVHLSRADGSVLDYPPPAGFERNDMYLDEMRYFIDLLNHKAKERICDYWDGKKALELAWAIIHSGRYGRKIMFDEQVLLK